MNDRNEQGARIVIQRWLRLKKWERALIVTSDCHIEEAEILKKTALNYGRSAELMIVEKRGKHVGVFFDKNEAVFDGYDAVIGATDYSLVTTKAVKKIIRRGKKFLSFPLNTNDGRSMLGYDFLKMDTKKSKMMASLLMKYLNASSCIRITTKTGTDLKLYKRNRTARFFNGDVKDGRGFSSASIEVYIPVEERMTEGKMIVDGSLGYIGKVKEPFEVHFQEGKIKEIEDGKDGRRLREYMKEFQDDRIYIAGELGIGLNSYASCDGRCYIEDESAYGTFHIGLGRNIALGGIQKAVGHFDIVAKNPDLYADNRKIMEDGKIVIPEPDFY